MAEKIGDAFVEIGTRTQKLDEGLKKSRRSVASFTDASGRRVSAFGARTTAAMGRATRSVAVLRTAIGLLRFAFAGLLVVGGFRAFRGVIRAINEQREQQVKLAAVLRATGNAAGFTRKQLEEQASALQKLTTFGDEAIISTQAILATFKQIKGEQFQEATKAILDMSIVLGQDAKQGAIQLGKALNDPILGVTALRRVGVAFTDSQREQIKVLVQSGNIMAAQSIILRELQDEFGGAAEAASATLGGKLKQLSNSFGDLKESIGATLIDLFNLREDAENVADAFDKMVEKINLLNETGFFIALSENWTRTWKDIQEFVLTAVANMFLLVQNFALKTVTVMSNMRSTVKTIWENLTDDIGFQLAKVIAKVQDLPFLIAKPLGVDITKEITKGLADLPKLMLIPLKTAEELRKEIDDAIKKRLEENEAVFGKTNKAMIQGEQDLQKEKKKTESIFSDFAGILKKAQEAAFAGIVTPAARAAVGGFTPAARPAGPSPSGADTVPMQMLSELRKITRATEAFAVVG